MRVQLGKKLVLSVIATSTTIPIILDAATGDSLNLKHMYYTESDNRIDIDFTLLDFKKDFGADYSLSVSASHDSISGGTPVWDSKSGGSSVATSDVVSGPSPCVNEAQEYLCADTRTDNIIGDGFTTSEDNVYRNVHITDKRKAISASLTKRTLRRDEITVGLSHSKESDYKSSELALSYLYNLTEKRNRSFSVGISHQANDEFFYRDKSWKGINITNFQVGYTHTLSKKTVAQANFFAIKQSGALSNPYQTIVRKFDVSLDDNPYYKYYLSTEKRPDNKNAAGLSFDFSSKVLGNTALHGFYRLYKDDWGVLSHTVSANAFIDLGKNWTLAPLVRFYKQSEASFYKNSGSEDYTFNQTDYGSADERLGAFNSMTYSLGVEKKVNNKLKLDAFVSKQHQSNGLDLNWVHVGLNYSF